MRKAQTKELMNFVREKDKEIKNLQELNGEIMFDNAELKTKLKDKEEAVEGILNPRQVAGIFEDWQQQNKFKYDEKYFMTFIEWSNYLLKQLKKNHTK